MAVTGKFLADFSSFSDAVQKAEVQLRGMESGAGKVEKSLNRMVDGFSGRKLIQDATLSAEAIERIGGTSKLTTSELQRVSAQAAAAADKLRAMGQDVPPGIQQIADKAKSAGGALSSMKTIAGTVAGALGVGLSIGAVVSFGKSVFNAASQIHDMAEQLGVSTDAAQGFKFAADQAGSSIGTVGTAITKMNDHLTDGDKGTVDALNAAGLSFQAIRSMKPEDAFLAITDAIQKIPDPMVQSNVALQLFGKSAAELLPAIKEGFRGAAEGASKMSAETIKSLEAAEDAWEKLSNKVIIVTGTIIAHTMSAASQATSSWKDFAQFVADSAKYGVAVASTLADARGAAVAAAGRDINLTVEGLHKTKDELAALEAAQKKAAAEAEKLATAQKELNARFVDAERALKPLTDAQELQITQYLALKLSVADIAAKMHLGTREVQQWADGVTAMNKIVGQSIPLINRWKDSLSHSADGLVPMIQMINRAWPTAIEGLTPVSTATKVELDAMAKAAKKAAGEIEASFVPLGQKITDALGSALSRIPQLLEQAFTGGGNILGAMKALGVAMADAIVTPIIAGLNKVQKAALATGTSAATILGGSAAGGMGAQVAGIAAGLGGAALAASAWGTSMAAAGVAGTVALGAATLGIGAAAVGAVVLIKHLTGTKGRDAVKKFAEDNGGFDKLHAQLSTLGTEGEALWVKLTQGVGRNSPKQAVAVIDEITAAWDRHQSKVAEDAATVDKQAQAQTEASQKALDQIKGLNDQIDSLNQSIANEAPEEIMGVIETQTRAQIAAITKQRDEAQLALDDVAGDAADAAEQAAKAIEDTLKAHDFVVKLRFDSSDMPNGDTSARNLPGFATGTNGYQNFGRGTAVMLHGWEKVTPRGKVEGATQQTIVTNVVMDGEVLLRQVSKTKKRLGIT